jgi:hypothetical protein
VSGAAIGRFRRLPASAGLRRRERVVDAPMTTGGGLRLAAGATSGINGIVGAPPPAHRTVRAAASARGRLVGVVRTAAATRDRLLRPPPAAERRLTSRVVGASVPTGDRLLGAAPAAEGGLVSIVRTAAATRGRLTSRVVGAPPAAHRRAGHGRSAYGGTWHRAAPAGIGSAGTVRTAPTRSIRAAPAGNVRTTPTSSIRTAAAGTIRAAPGGRTFRRCIGLARSTGSTR